MLQDKPVSLAVAGLGGYAGAMIGLVREHRQAVSPRVALSAVCDPRPDLHAELVADLQADGVTVYSSYDEMLQHPGLESVWLPVPIDLHVPFAKKALQRGLSVLVEKPVAGTIDEVDELIAARDAAGRPVFVGFQDVFDDAMPALKQRILNGEIGRVERASVWACWPRTRAYFDRASWAGAMKRGTSWVLDSPVNNALAHFVNVPLFMMGKTLDHSAVPARIDAELYRAAKIENYDTASLKVTMEDGVELMVLFTHACDKLIHPTVSVIGSKGRAIWTIEEAGIVPNGPDGKPTPTPLTRRSGAMRRDMLQSLARRTRGLPDPDHCAATLEVARSHTLVINGASQASPVTPVPDALVKTIERDNSFVRAVPGIEPALREAAERGVMLHDTGALPFTVPAHGMSLTGYDHFAGPFSSADTNA